MDYKEEQSNEVEALESIYYGDMIVIATEPFASFSIPIQCTDYDAETETGMQCRLVFTYTAKYPDEEPRIEVEDDINFEDNYQAELLEHLSKEIKENVGMVMVFTLVSSAQEWLNVKWDEHKRFKEEEASRKQQEEEEAEQKRFDGTRVTVETFMKWKIQFEEEMGIAKKREALERDGKKLTGRELFMTDTTLNESDLQFLDEGDAVKVDESLFQDLDDLDLDEEDDEDYDPCASESDTS